jgi:hypothetical protein
VSARVALRLLALAGVALVAALVALAVTSRDSNSSSATLPEAAPAPGGGWFKAMAAPLPAIARTRRTDCNVALGPRTIGVAHPVLPCRAQVYVEFEGERVLTRVIGRGAPRLSEFGLTSALAEELGVHDRRQIQWRFAAAPS